MPAGGDERWVALDDARRSYGGVEPLVETVHTERPQCWTGGSFDAVHLDFAQASIDEVGSQFFGSVQVGGGKTDDAAVEPSCGLQLGYERFELGGEPPVAAQVHQRRVTADPRGDHRGTGAGDTAGFAQRLETILSLWLVIQGAEQQHGVLGVVVLLQRTGIADCRQDTGEPSGHRDVLIDRVDQLHGVATLGQPLGMDSGAAPDIEHRRRWRRQEPGQQLLGPHPLQHPVRSLPQPVVFTEAVDVIGVHLRVHSASLANPGQSHRRASALTMVDRGWPRDGTPSAEWKTHGVGSCDECGFVYDDHVAPAVVNELASLGPRLASRLHRASGDAEHEAALRLRPAPGVWSALEYACHVRDVLIAQRERLLLALVEDCPGFAPIYREQRAVLARYAESDPAQVAAQVNVVAVLVADTFDGIDQTAWRRECIYNFPAPAKRSVAWLAAHTLHEGEHHLQDFDRVMLQVADAAPSP